jgi:hypothetical protein
VYAVSSHQLQSWRQAVGMRNATPSFLPPAAGVGEFLLCNAKNQKAKKKKKKRKSEIENLRCSMHHTMIELAPELSNLP